MDTRILRVLLFLLLGLITVFSALIFLNDIRAKTHPAPKEEKRDNVADSYMQGMLTNPVIRQNVHAAAAALSTAAVPGQAGPGGMMVVRNKAFEGVVDKPKDLMAEMRERAGERHKPDPIALKGPSARVVPPGGAARDKALSGASVPEPGSGGGGEGALFSVPASYKLFGSAALWKPFRESRGLKSADPDFSAWDMLILTPGGDYPPGILAVTAVESGPAGTVVNYRVDPLAMSAGADEEARERYAFAPVPKNRKIRLVQVR